MTKWNTIIERDDKNDAAMTSVEKKQFQIISEPNLENEILFIFINNMFDKLINLFEYDIGSITTKKHFQNG